MQALAYSSHIHEAKDQGCGMAHVGNAMGCDLGDAWLLVIAICREEDAGSCGDDKANACQQQQGATGFVEHGVELLVLVLGTSQQETAACEEQLAWLNTLLWDVVQLLAKPLLIMHICNAMHSGCLVKRKMKQTGRQW